MATSIEYQSSDATCPRIPFDPVMFWGGDTTKVSATDQQALTDYCYQVLREELGKKFQIVDQAGPGVMKLQAALTDAEGATPGLRTISMAVPQAGTLNTLKYAVTGTYAFVGGAQGEAKLTDAVSGQVLGQSRRGTTAPVRPPVFVSDAPHIAGARRR